MITGTIRRTANGTYIIAYKGRWYGYFQSNGDAQRWLYRMPR